MTLERRIAKLEGVVETDPGIILFDSTGRQIEGEIVRMPTVDTDGEALLADGTQRPIVYEDNWKNIQVMFSDNPCEEEPEERLRIRRADIVHIRFEDV